jgi:pyruvate dehydrogenase E2 component (dihydrolipoamide acetyltransferase)
VIRYSPADHLCPRLALRTSAPASALSKFQMPAMSPTMTEGGIAQWKMKEGDTFTAGDVLVEIETDKATIDVEAQDDGVLAKIIVSRREHRAA